MTHSNLPTARRRRLITVVALATVVSLLAACGGGTTAPSSTPAAAVDTAPPARPSSSAPVTVSPSASDSAVPSGSPTSSAVASSGPLKLLWQKAGPTTIRAETYWPAIDPLTGDIWVADSRENKYWIFKPDGTYVGSWGTPGHGPGQLQLTTNEPTPGSVGAIAFAPDGSFYVADDGNYRVEAFDKDRHFVRSWGSFGTDDGQFANPKGIATDGKVVYVADDDRLDVQVFDLKGTFLRKFPFPFVLFSLAPDGRLVVAEHPVDKVDLVDGIGKTLASYPIDFSTLGFSCGAADGCLSMAVEEASGSILVGMQDDSGPVGLLEIDQHGAIVRRWTTGSETMLLSPDGASLYMASTGPALSSWPYLRKYALPKG
jgi:sugar lactone lactonase YvrE